MIQAINLYKFYGTSSALSGISLEISQGEIYGIIGLSGAGKSTLLRCLSRLIIPDQGTVLFEGHDISLLKGNDLRAFHRKTGMIFQNFHLLSSRTAAENISYPLELLSLAEEKKKNRINELLHLVGLSSKRDMYPSALSGGQKQRVGIARALANNPKVLFCDEATSALDPQTTHEILDLLQHLNRSLGLTIILITHDMEVIKKICTKTAVIEAGKIVEEGLVADIFSSPRHPTTRRLIQSSLHEIPPELLSPSSPNRKLLRLRFKGHAAGEPIIARMIKQFDVEANILLGWIDRLQSISIGTLVIELRGENKNIQGALSFLTQNSIHWESLEHAL